MLSSDARHIWTYCIFVGAKKWEGVDHPEGFRRPQLGAASLAVRRLVRICLTVPPLALEKRFSRPGCGEIFPLFSRVMRVGLFTAFARGCVNSFSEADECAVLVFSLSAAESKAGT